MFVKLYTTLVPTYLDDVFGVGVEYVGGRMFLVQNTWLEERVARRDVRKAVHNTGPYLPG
jgi:hypothetical protein